MIFSRYTCGMITATRRLNSLLARFPVTFISFSQFFSIARRGSNAFKQRNLPVHQSRLISRRRAPWARENRLRRCTNVHNTTHKSITTPLTSHDEFSLFLISCMYVYVCVYFFFFLNKKVHCLITANGLTFLHLSSSLLYTTYLISLFRSFDLR